jgi:hypothetical protein
MWDLWWEEQQWGTFSASTLVSSANSHFINCSMLINHQHYIVSMLIASLNKQQRKNIFRQSSKLMSSSRTIALPWRGDFRAPVTRKVMLAGA